MADGRDLPYPSMEVQRKEVMVPAQDLGLPCGSWDVQKELTEGPPRLDLQLWRGRLGSWQISSPGQRPRKSEREEILLWLLLFSLPPVSSQWLPLADRKPAGKEPGKCSFLGALL